VAAARRLAPQRNVPVGREQDDSALPVGNPQDEYLGAESCNSAAPEIDRSDNEPPENVMRVI
jgi:hypothetical protein